MNRCYIKQELKGSQKALINFVLLALFIDALVVGTHIALSYIQRVPKLQEINLLVTHLFILIFYFLILGIVKGSSEFHLMLSVTGNRGAYLRQFVVWSIVISMVFTFISMVMAYTIGLMVILFIDPRGIEFVGVNINYFFEVPFILWIVIGIGFLIGSVYYRLKARSFGILVAMSVWLILINENYRLIGDFLSKRTGWECVLGGVICFGIGIVLLRKAPIMCYAHDLI